jgi:hypothetical protein
MLKEKSKDVIKAQLKSKQTIERQKKEITILLESLKVDKFSISDVHDHLSVVAGVMAEQLEEAKRKIMVSSLSMDKIKIPDGKKELIKIITDFLADKNAWEYQDLLPRLSNAIFTQVAKKGIYEPFETLDFSPITK